MPLTWAEGIYDMRKYRFLENTTLGNEMRIIQFNNGLEQWHVQILQSINHLSPQDNSSNETLMSNDSASLKTQTQENKTENSAHHSSVET